MISLNVMKPKCQLQQFGTGVKVHLTSAKMALAGLGLGDSRIIGQSGPSGLKRDRNHSNSKVSVMRFPCCHLWWRSRQPPPVPGCVYSRFTFLQEKVFCSNLGCGALWLGDEAPWAAAQEPRGRRAEMVAPGARSETSFHPRGFEHSHHSYIT